MPVSEIAHAGTTAALTAMIAEFWSLSAHPGSSSGSGKPAQEH
ncbi:hypothetical protein [Gimesia chilikensis]|nr:hypothetical protein [Gimesia chilikensis]